MKAEKHEREQRARVTIKTREEANAALKEIGQITDQKQLILVRERNVIRDAEKRIADETAPLDKQIAAREKTLEKWAETNKQELFKESRSVEMECGWLGYRWGKWRMKFLVVAETVVNRIAAKGRRDLLRVVKEPDVKKLLDYDNDFLEPFGLKKIRREKFFCEPKPEVKG